MRPLFEYMDGYVLAIKAHSGDTQFYVSDDRFKYDFDDRIERAKVFITACDAAIYAETHADKLCKSWQGKRDYTILQVIAHPVETITVEAPGYG